MTAQDQKMFGWIHNSMGSIKNIFFVIGVVLISTSGYAQDSKHEIGLNLMTNVRTPYASTGKEKYDGITVLSGVCYKLYTDTLTLRAYLGRESIGFEIGDRNTSEPHQFFKSNGSIVTIGVQKGWIWGKTEFSGFLDLKYERRIASGEDWGGLAFGGRKYDYNDKIIGLAPGFNLTYRLTPKLSMQYETNVVVQQVNSVENYITSGADLYSSRERTSSETYFKPISGFVVCLKF